MDAERSNRSLRNLLFLVALVASSNLGNDRQDINLSEDGGYTDVLIAIDDRVPENPKIIDKLKEYFTEASKVLLTATNQRLYFKSLTIVVPETWTPSNWLEPTEQETKKRARVTVAEANLAYGDEPYTLQRCGCREEGEHIHFTPDYLTAKSLSDKTYRPSKRIVKEFAKLRWGLFDENIPVNDKETSQFYLEEGYFFLNGCVKEFGYPPLTHCHIENDLPSPTCRVEPTFSKGSASLLAYEYFDDIIHFCTNDSDYNTDHDILSRNLQNENCNDSSAWQIMKDHEDLDTDYGLDRPSNSVPAPEFRIVQKKPDIIVKEKCNQDVVCLCMDVSGSMTINKRITVMSEAVMLYLLTFIREGSAVGLVSFSSGATMLASMTDVTSKMVRESLMAKVPTVANGGTDIAAGIRECQRMIHEYTDGEVSNARILLHSDGKGNIDNSIEEITSQGILLDTVLFDQGGYLRDQAEDTGGRQFLASDEIGQIGLLAFYEETASRYCETEARDAVVAKYEAKIPAGQSSYYDRIFLDQTIGINTRIVFQSNTMIQVRVSELLNATVTEEPSLMAVIISIPNKMDQFIEFTITKENPADEASVIVTATSSPIPGTQAIEVIHYVNSRTIDFGPTTEIISYIGVFQGFTPVQELAVNILLEDPTETLTLIRHSDDGTGMDSVANDGFYTGYLPAHLIKGTSNNQYYGLDIDISGEGTLPTQGNVGTRMKRCVLCTSLGNVTRSSAGGVLVIKNWYSVPDTTPPEKIKDLTVIEASEASGLFSLRWTAPGEDLNIGRASGYEFGVGVNVSEDVLVSLDPAAILNNISDFLVKAGTQLKMKVNASLINSTVFGLPESAKVSTYYFRIRTYDSSNNFASWSNPASASFPDPELLAALLGLTTTTTSPTPTTENKTEVDQRTPAWFITLGSSLIAAGVVIFATVVGVYMKFGKCRATSTCEGRQDAAETNPVQNDLYYEEVV